MKKKSLILIGYNHDNLINIFTKRWIPNQYIIYTNNILKIIGYYKHNLIYKRNLSDLKYIVNIWKEVI